ncbi:signal recognition particle, SRP9/SRP14 subunit [Fimicolochytrium jonesii]|uniref:signal recognition particle, SRP9/SRP14 subunit n=1 Tax=Fimicolochytrium jonesii TaxID=1396493 RepID=UPI0022FEE6A7|nr:signal recognition particle, SRP9/SRP14 subunit [Fimicolochytrium jonesii]KAI8825038.1 signal recognition particle, SRP9/SRP14 subunit [Fimicolochytrium jonesii]
MPLLSNDGFLSQLNTLYSSAKASGTVYVTMKRYAYEEQKQKRKDEKSGASAPIPSSSSETTSSTYPCLIRAVCRNSKISTLVQPQDTDRFHDAYTNIVRLHMDSLKKKERVKKVKSKAKAKAKDAMQT